MDVSEYLSSLTIEEKAALCMGGDFWHTVPVKKYDLPAVMLTDGPHGLRKQRRGGRRMALGKSVLATCFPAAVTSACSFDRELLALEGAAIGEEARAEGVGLLLGPGLNIKRHPLCGRNFEYFSEDPCLAGELAAAFVSGVQSQGVGACLKHFACNSQETGRMTSDSIVDERALREIYLSAFETAVKKSAPMAVMGAYNRINGVYACENKALLTDILRQEWGFEGLVVTDWGAMNDVTAAIPAGLDLEMPASGGERTVRLAEAVKNGQVPMEALDRAAGNVLRFVLAVKDNEASPYDRGEHHEKARRIARESAVLLQNDGLLPFDPAAHVAVIGAFGQAPRYQGAGSSLIRPTEVTSPLEALDERGVTYLYCNGESLDEARIAARAGQGVILFTGLSEEAESEGFDRKTMALSPAQNELIETVLSVNPRTAVVLMGGGVMELPWAGKAAAILYMGLGGQAAGGAAIDLLFGDDNPSGHLAETWPAALSDCPAADFGKTGPVQYRESVFVGYRYYDTAKKPVAFPFGHGLSYTDFEYSGLSIQDMTVSATVTNTGCRAGRAVVQLYIAPPPGMVFRPAHELRDFAKVYLEPGQSETVRFTLSERAFSFWNSKTHSWCVQGGAYTVELGQSSRDIRLTGTIELRRPSPDVENYRTNTPAYYELDKKPALAVPRWQFEELTGRELKAEPDGPLTMNSTLADIQDRAMGRAIMKLAVRASGGAGQPAMMEAMVGQMPFRSFAMSGIRLSVLEKLIARMNKERALGKAWSFLRKAKDAPGNVPPAALLEAPADRPEEPPEQADPEPPEEPESGGKPERKRREKGKKPREKAAGSPRQRLSLRRRREEDAPGEGEETE